MSTSTLIFTDSARSGLVVDFIRGELTADGAAAHPFMWNEVSRKWYCNEISTAVARLSNDRRRK